jgi:hypothetical protein
MLYGLEVNATYGINILRELSKKTIKNLKRSLMFT